MAKLKRPLRNWVHGIPQLARLAREVLQARNGVANWVDLCLGYFGLRSVAEGMTYTLRSAPGVSLVVWEPHDLRALWGIFCAGEYEVGTEDSLIVDIGANVGLFAIYAALQAPRARVICLEPARETYEKLRRQVNMSQAGTRIECRLTGVAGSPGQRTLYVGDHSGLSSLYRPETTPGGRTESVQMTTLDALIDELSPEPVSLLKMDCEGAEWEIFDTTSDESLKRINRVCLEYHPVPGRSVAQLAHRLVAQGLLCKKLTRRHDGTGLAWFSSQRQTESA